jgi:hypothetical protein
MMRRPTAEDDGAVRVQGFPVVVSGTLVRTATIADERFIDGDRLLADPDGFVAALRASRIPADLFTFVQNAAETTPSLSSHVEWDDAAVIPIISYDDWLHNRVAKHVARNLRRAVSRGVVIRRVDFDDVFVRGITDVYNETPVRQGRRFPHYGKGFDLVKREVSHRLDRSQFLAAYYQDELIGFAKLLRAGSTEHMVLILSKMAHRDKSPTSALIARAVDLCAREGASFLRYGRFTYVGRQTSSLSEFKLHNGFERVSFPRYYVPLTRRGALAIRLNLHRGASGAIPERILDIGRRVRSIAYGAAVSSKLVQGMAGASAARAGKERG